MRRVWTALVLACSLASGLSAQDERAPLRAEVDSLLSTLRVRDILMHLGGAVEGQIGQMAPQLTPEQMARTREVVARHFAVETLYRGVASNIAEEAEPEALRELLESLTSGAVAEARRMADAYQPSRCRKRGCSSSPGWRGRRASDTST